MNRPQKSLEKTQIDRCIAAKSGDTQFALFFDDGAWTAMIGNRSRSVRLGEIDGEFVATAGTAFEAVTDLLAKIKGMA